MKEIRRRVPKEGRGDLRKGTRTRSLALFFDDRSVEVAIGSVDLELKHCKRKKE